MFVFQENFKREHSTLVYLHDRVLNSTGKNLGTVEKVKMIDMSSVINRALPQTNTKYRNKGASESNFSSGVIRVMGRLKLSSYRKPHKYQFKCTFLRDILHIIHVMFEYVPHILVAFVSILSNHLRSQSAVTDS